MKIRKAKMSDVPKVLMLSAIVGHVHWEVDPKGKSWDEAMKDLEYEYKTAIKSKDRDVFVAEYDWGIVGFMAVSRRDKVYVEVTEASVLPGLQGTGVGGKLFERSLAWARQKKARKLVVFASRIHKQAIPFWEKMGFRTSTAKMMERDVS